MAVVTHDEFSDVFFWNCESLKEYWDCILNALIWTEDDIKGHRPDLIVYDRGDITLIIHEGKKVEELFLEDGTIPDPSTTENSEFNIFQTIINFQLEGGDTDKWNKLSICVWGFLGRPLQEFTICTSWRRHSLTTKSEKGRVQK